MQKVRTLFVVDDDTDDRELFLEALSEIDSTIRCITAQNGEDALNQLNGDLSSQPDFIFLDLNMPRLNGKQCLVEIKKISRLSDVPVIIYSTSSALKDIEETTRLGAAHFFTKPSSFEQLCSQLTGILSNNWKP